MNARDFISPPFMQCPKCGAHDEFGGLMVGRRSHTRRCRACWHTATFPLPPLNVSVVYLDQNILSNMLRVLDPATPKSKRERMEREKHLDFFTHVFMKIHRLVKLHLIICPKSPIHFEESVLSRPDFEKLKRIYGLLSHGVQFSGSDEIRNLQLIQRAAQFVSNPGGPEIQLEIEMVTQGEINAWRDRFRIEMSSVIIEGLPEELREVKKQKISKLKEVWSFWAANPNSDFEFWYRSERNALCKILGDTLIKVFRRHIERKFGLRQISDEDIFPDENQRLVFALQKAICGQSSDLSDFKRVWSFLESDELDKVPHIRISSAIYAALANRAGGGQKAPSRSPFNDCDAISAYLPYCDAMFLDNEMEHILADVRVSKKVGCSTRVFSLRKKAEFIDYLDALESQASLAHLAKVREVYGDRWEDPFVEIFSS